jgi:hypothetical protein
MSFNPERLRHELRSSHDDSQVKPRSLYKEPGMHKSHLEMAEAVICWQLNALGFHQHEIAAVFKVNQRCVHEVLREKKHVGSRDLAKLAAPTH